MGKKLVFGGLSAILLVAAVVGVVASVMKSHHKAGDNFSVPESDNGGLLTSAKSVTAICGSTNYKESCERTLNGAVNGSTSPEEVMRQAVKATIDEFHAAFQRTGEYRKLVKSNDSFGHLQLEGCETLLKDAADELRATLKLIGDDVKGVVDRSDDLYTWLGAVITYQEDCTDSVTDPELKAKMKKSLDYAREMTSNAIQIVDILTSVFQGLPASIKDTDAQRRRLLTDERYPRWLSVADRKLLAAGGAKPNAVVAKDGSGNFRSINDAVKSIPEKYRRWVIYVKAGVYEENVIIPKEKPNVLMYGDGPTRTIVSGSKSNRGGVPTFMTATFAAEGKGFIAKSMGFRNTAGPEGHQAVAFRSKGDKTAVFNCRMDGYQDTLYVQAARQFYSKCTVTGTVDFIFGDSSTILQNCLIIVRRPMDGQANTITAHGRSEQTQRTALVLQNCQIVPEKALFPVRFRIESYFGRPWKSLARTIVMESTIGDFIRPEGWLPWGGAPDSWLSSVYCAEYANRGPGANTRGRVKWPGFHLIDRKRAQRWTAIPLLWGQKWLKHIGAPVQLGFTH